MIDNTKIQVFDGDLEIVFSNTFNVYDDELRVKPIGGYELVFKFKKDPNQEGFPMSMREEKEEKRLILTLINFQATLGAGTTQRISLMNIGEGAEQKEVFFSIHVKSLNDTTTYLQVTLTLYVK